YPDVLFALTRTLAAWLRAEPRAPSRGCVAVAITAAGADVPLAAFVDRLVTSLGALAPTLRLDAREMDARFGAGAALCPDGSPGHSLMTSWINEQEAGHEVVVYEADAAPTAWTRRCLRQADHILVLARAEGEPSLGPLAGELERLEDEQGRQIEQLVLLH